MLCDERRISRRRTRRGTDRGSRPGPAGGRRDGTDGADGTDATVTAPVAAPPAKRTGGRVRTVVACVLGALAVVMLVVASIGVWAKATVLQQDRFTSLVEDALARAGGPGGTGHLHHGHGLRRGRRPGARHRDPAATARSHGGDASPPASSRGLRRRARRCARQRTDPERAATRSSTGPTTAMELLRGDGLVDGINVVDGEVTLNTLPLIGRGLEAIQSLGLLSNLDIPELTADGDPHSRSPSSRRRSAATCPTTSGNSSCIKATRSTVRSSRCSRPSGCWCSWSAAWSCSVIAALVLLAATVLVAPRRWRATMALGLGTATAVGDPALGGAPGRRRRAGPGARSRAPRRRSNRYSAAHQRACCA